MKNFALKIKRFLESEDGPTAVEYAVMLALIVIVCLTAIQAIGTNANPILGQTSKLALDKRGYIATERVHHVVGQVGGEPARPEGAGEGAHVTEDGGRPPGA